MCVGYVQVCVCVLYGICAHTSLCVCAVCVCDVHDVCVRDVQVMHSLKTEG